MELSRVDYTILKFLKKKNCTKHFMGATLQEIMQITKNTRPTTYRKMMNLQKCGYVEKDARQSMQILSICLKKELKL